jgi:hypothetical protein
MYSTPERSWQSDRQAQAARQDQGAVPVILSYGIVELERNSQVRRPRIYLLKRAAVPHPIAHIASCPQPLACPRRPDRHGHGTNNWGVVSNVVAAPLGGIAHSGLDPEGGAAGLRRITKPSIYP